MSSTPAGSVFDRMLAARQGNSRNPIWIPDDEEEEDDEFEGDEEYDADAVQDADYVQWAQYGAPLWPCCSVWVRSCYSFLSWDLCIDNICADSI